MAVQPPTSSRTSHSFGGMNTDISDFAPVAGIARCESDSWWRRDTRKRCRDSRPRAYLRGLGERLQVIVKVPGHSVDGKPQKPYVRELVEVDDEAVFDCLGVRVDANRFPEDLFGLDVFLRGWKIRHE